MASERRKRPGRAVPPRPVSGYSGTPLAKKLGIGPGARLYLQAAPANYQELLAPALRNARERMRDNTAAHPRKRAARRPSA